MQHPYLPSLLLKELSDTGAKIPQQLFSNMKQLYNLFADILKRGEKEGVFQKSIPMVVYFMIIGSINLIVTTKDIRSQAKQEDNLDTCADCDIDEIADYIAEKLEIMLKG